MRVRVRAVPGRIVNTAPKGGRRITHSDEGEVVELTSWIHRAINFYGDLEVVPDKPPKKAPPAPKGDTLVPPPPAD